MSTAEQTKPVFSWKQKPRTPAPEPPMELKRQAFADINGKSIRLTVDSLTGDAWVWSVDFRFPPYLSVLGRADDAESAQKEAQAVVELFSAGRSLYLDRVPTLSAAEAPATKSVSVQEITTAVLRDYSIAQSAHELRTLLARLDAVKRAAEQLVAKRHDDRAVEALLVLKYITGESHWLSLLDRYKNSGLADADTSAPSEGKSDGL